MTRCARGRGVRVAAVGLALLLALPVPAVRARESAQPRPFSSAGPAREPRPSPPLRKILEAVRAEAKRYAKDSAALLEAPLSWSGRDWTRFAGAGLIVGGFLVADREIDEIARRQRSGFTDRVSRATTGLGGSWGPRVSVTLLAGGLLFDRPEVRDMGRDALEAGLFGLMLNRYVLKPAFGRHRPSESGGRTVFEPASGHDSFPSGHATEAFAVASVVAARSHGWIVPAIAYFGATVVAMDRVNDEAHFASDVVAGGLLGTAIGRFLVNRHRNASEGGGGVAFEIVPSHRGLAARILF